MMMMWKWSPFQFYSIGVWIVAKCSRVLVGWAVTEGTARTELKRTRALMMTAITAGDGTTRVTNQNQEHQWVHQKIHQ